MVKGKARDGDGSIRERYLAAAVDYVIEHGAGDLSLRPLAEGIGTSHRMLLYHFGSKEQLLVEIVREIERRERELVNRSVPDARRGSADPTAPPDPVDILRTFWQRISQPRYAARERLFFELYGRALQGRDGTASLLDGIIDDWTAPAAVIEEARGADPDEARARSRLAVAVTRGLLLDLLATGDRKATTAAFELFLTMMDQHVSASTPT